MSFFRTDLSVEAIKENSFESITTSGIYPVEIEFISVVTNEHKARSLNFNLIYKGSGTTLYGLKLDTNKGDAHFQRAIFNKLCIIAGLDEIDNPEEQTHFLGKDKKETNLWVLEQFSNLKVKVRVQFQYNQYNGKIYENKNILAFYRDEDNATAQEIIDNTPKGVQYEKDLPYSTKVDYKPPLTEAIVTDWKNSKNNSSTTEETTKNTTSSKKDPFLKS